MDQSSTNSASSLPKSQQCPVAEPSSVLSRRQSWSGSRKINVCEQDDVDATEVAGADLAARPDYVSSLIAGVGSGSLASVVCAPLDLVRTRLQVAGGLGKSARKARIIKSLYEVYLVDGVRGCFRGLGATLATVPAFWGIYFPLYEAAVTAGAVADVICNPLFLVRTRMQTEALHYFQMPSSERMPHGLASTVRSLYKEGGLPIFWRGLTASLLGLGHVGIQFPVYERLKAEARRRSPDGEESPLDLLIASGLSKMSAAVITYPHEVIRSRMMDARGPLAGLNVYRTAQHIIQNEGYAGLYAGMRVTLFRVVPNCCVTFVSYELIARWVRAKTAQSKADGEK